MTEWHLDPDERRVAHARALAADDELRESYGSGEKAIAAVGAGYIASKPHFESLGDAKLADASDVPLEHVDPLDA